MHIYYLKYNNYYNRKFKREASLPDYLTYEIARTENLTLWNPADGVETSIVANIDIPFGAAQPDYAVLQGDTVDDYINSRWFIMEMVQLRKGQYRVSLRRDVIVDSIEVLENTTNFLAQRGFVEQNNKLVLQPEDISVNRIKTKETLIKDETGVSWLVGYLNRSYSGGTFNGNMEITPYKEYASFNDFEYNNYFTEWFKGYTSDESTWFTLYWYKTPFVLNNWIRSWDIRSSSIKQNSDWKSATTVGYMTYINNKQEDYPTLEAIQNTFGSNTWIPDIKNRFGIKSLQETNDLLSWKNTIIKVGDLYYKITIEEESFVYEETLNRTDAYNSANTIRSLCENTLHGSLKETLSGSSVYTFHSSGVRYKLHKEELHTDAGFSFTIPADRPKLDDAPYDMFAIPYGKYNNFGDEQIAMKTASILMAALNVESSGNLYDIQLLPFAPKLSNTTTDIKNASDAVIGKIYWSTESTETKTILLDNPLGLSNRKLDSIINLYRIVSPNYSGQFEFTTAANNFLYGFNIAYTYVPFNPYIRVAPIFGGLYGQEFNDARGLICGGDFSLPAVNSAWISYQQNNKNYNAIFNRNIENLEFTNNINRRFDTIGAVVGTAQGAASGAATGAQLGGGFGAVAGGIIGGSASAIGGASDAFLNERLRQEQLSLTRDLQRLNLGNIQAQPYSLAKTTPFTASNKIFPILEYYTCSEEEKALVEAFLENNSFNLGAVIPFKTLLTTRYNEKARQWIQGRVVEFPNNFGEDYHFAAILNQELAQGYSFKEYTEV